MARSTEPFGDQSTRERGAYRTPRVRGARRRTDHREARRGWRRNPYRARGRGANARVPMGLSVALQCIVFRSSSRDAGALHAVGLCLSATRGIVLTARQPGGRRHRPRQPVAEDCGNVVLVWVCVLPISCIHASHASTLSAFPKVVDSEMASKPTTGAGTPPPAPTADRGHRRNGAPRRARRPSYHLTPRSPASPVASLLGIGRVGERDPTSRRADVVRRRTGTAPPWVYLFVGGSLTRAALGYFFAPGLSAFFSRFGRWTCWALPCLGGLSRAVASARWSGRQRCGHLLPGHQASSCSAQPPHRSAYDERQAAFSVAGILPGLEVPEVSEVPV